MDTNEVNSWPNGWMKADQKVVLPDEEITAAEYIEKDNTGSVIKDGDGDVETIDGEEVEDEEEDLTNELVSETGAPYYDYVKKVPKYIKYRKGGNFFDTLYALEDNITRSTGILITGKESCPKRKDFRIGEKFYFTSGVCGAESTEECVGEPRNIIVDNIPGKKKGNEGLIPSIIGDFGAFEPVEIIKSIAGKGVTVNERCSKQEIEVKQLNPGGKPYVRTESLCVPDYSLGIQPYVDEDSVEDIVEDFSLTKTPCGRDKYLLIGLVLVLSGLIAYERSF
tara:strand:+ start:6062 stop:6901 length:840 start_codon:yes stop_codon:yes gene_type:complete